MNGNEDVRKSKDIDGQCFSDDEFCVIDMLANALEQGDFFKSSADEYLLSFSWNRISLISDLDDGCLVEALNRLRRRTFEVVDRKSSIVNGLIMRAKIQRDADVLEVLIGAELAHHLVYLASVDRGGSTVSGGVSEVGSGPGHGSLSELVSRVSAS